MDPARDKYLLLYAAVVILVALSILFMRRGSKAPVRLRLGDRGSAPKPPAAANASALVPTSAEVPLNVLFNWNGHTWDAYEVFGVPAGSSRDVVRAAYEKAVKNATDDSRPFFKAAFDAISG